MAVRCTRPSVVTALAVLIPLVWAPVCPTAAPASAPQHTVPQLGTRVPIKHLSSTHAGVASPWVAGTQRPLPSLARSELDERYGAVSVDACGTDPLGAPVNCVGATLGAWLDVVGDSDTNMRQPGLASRTPRVCVPGEPELGTASDGARGGAGDGGVATVVAGIDVPTHVTSAACSGTPSACRCRAARVCMDVAGGGATWQAGAAALEVAWGGVHAMVAREAPPHNPARTTAAWAAQHSGDDSGPLPGVWQATLAAGDVLVIPEGWHYATVAEAPSAVVMYVCGATLASPRHGQATTQRSRDLGSGKGGAEGSQDALHLYSTAVGAADAAGSDPARLRHALELARQAAHTWPRHPRFARLQGTLQARLAAHYDTAGGTHASDDDSVDSAASNDGLRSQAAWQAAAASLTEAWRLDPSDVGSCVEAGEALEHAGAREQALSL